MGGPSSLGHAPDGQWRFDKTVTDCFDDMLSRSIPQYDAMRIAVTTMATRFLDNGGVVVDLGCSRGGGLAPLVEHLGDKAAYVGVDVSAPMVKACRARFAKEIKDGLVSIRMMDLRKNYPLQKAAVTLCVLTLQFTPIEYRQKIMRRAFESILPGGALILVEKVLGEGAILDDALVNAYYDHKLDSGYSQAAINIKRRSLEGVLTPVTARMNEDFLRGAGFAAVDCFWRCLNFAGWLAIKETPRA